MNEWEESMNDLVIFAILFGLIAVTLGVIRMCDRLMPRGESSKSESRQ